MNVKGLTGGGVLRLAGIGAVWSTVSCGDNEVSCDPGNSHAAFVVQPEQHSPSVVVWPAISRTAMLDVQSDDDITRSSRRRSVMAAGTNDGYAGLSA